MEPTIPLTLIIMYFASMLVCIIAALYVSYCEGVFGPTRGEMIMIVVLAIIPMVNTFYAVVITFDAARAAHETPLTRWLKEPLFNKGREQ